MGDEASMAVLTGSLSCLAATMPSIKFLASSLSRLSVEDIVMSQMARELHWRGENLGDSL
jgi:hypothetical protein